MVVSIFHSRHPPLPDRPPAVSNRLMTPGRRQTRSRSPYRTVAVAVAVAGLAVVPPVAATPGAPRDDFRGPLDGPVRVVTPYDPPAQRWGTGHRGVDLAADALDTVRSPADGTVAFAGHVAGRPVLSIDHSDGLRTTYEPVRATVEQGDPVRSGQAVGYLLAGHPGCPAPACLHWGARLASGGPTGGDDDYVDPLDLLGAHSRPIALKPLRPGDRAAG